MSLIDIVKEHLEKQSNIDFAYVFGSYARGDIKLSSDIDIAIYFNAEITTKDYLILREELMKKTKKEIDIVILNDAEPLIKYIITQEGELLFARSKEQETAFKVKVLFEYDDIKKYLDLSYNSMVERLIKEVQDGR